MAVFNPFLPSFQADPYPQYAALRAADPVHFSLALQTWVLTAYEECALVLRDDETFSSSSNTASGQLAEVLQQQRREFPLGETPTVLNSDPPVHTRLRSLLNRAFTPRAIEGLRPRIEEIAASLLDDVDASNGRFDVATGFAQPLPIIVIAELLGVPPEDRDRFKRWSVAIARTTDVLNTPAILDAAREATRELIAYMDEVVAQRREAPGADILTALAAAEEEGERLSHDELLAFSILLLLAGHETTTNLIGNGLLALAARPKLVARLRSESSLLPAAVEELLRYDSSVQGVVRFARRRTELGGRTIEQGAALLPMVGAANRDPAQFDDPDELDLERSPNRHLAFGRGIHFCLGAPLARLEGEIAFAALLDRFAELRVAEDGVERSGTLLLRGVGRLELEA
ncbi:MAG: cytochrome P450 [Dehalococcoidia bacterium]|nr:cytochrome P450 [Dehalococcoidia bacterium]